MKCGSFTGCQNPISVIQTGVTCGWITHGGVCVVTIECMEAGDQSYWRLVITHGPTGKSCTYIRGGATKHDCPAGWYGKLSGNCPDCPGGVTVY